MPVLPLVKALVLAGCGSRRRMAEAVKQGRVLVNGEVAASFTQPVDAEKDLLVLDGQAVKPMPDKPVYLLLNKPPGFLSTTRDERGRPTVMDLLPEKYKHQNLYPVGRLDLDSRGLLLLTNDGDLTFRLTHPRFEKEKEYLVELDRPLSEADSERFEAGLELEDGMTWPVRLSRRQENPPLYSVVLHEGRKRQLRRMFGSLGYRVADLQRIRMGSFTLGALAEGETRELSAAEKAVILKPA
jgi:23S rRNA pseudouridine2605 synthase